MVTRHRRSRQLSILFPVWLLLLLLLLLVLLPNESRRNLVRAVGDSTDASFPLELYAGPDVGGIEDAHAVHGVQMDDGRYAIVGKGARCEFCKDAEGFAIVVDAATGSTVSAWTTGIAEDDVLNAVAQLNDGTGDLLVVGYRVVDGIGKRSVTRLAVEPGRMREVWTSTSFGDDASHGFGEHVASDVSTRFKHDDDVPEKVYPVSHVG